MMRSQCEHNPTRVATKPIQRDWHQSATETALVSETETGTFFVND